MGFLGFALKCFDVLAWPLISLGYPLCASVRAIEVNSNSDMKKLITYWILYSLISLFELGFSKLIEWIPFWPCVKLTAIFYLVLRRFHGAYHVYGCLVHPYFHVNPQVVINKFNKLKELSHNGENFLAILDKYVEENGLEALVKLIASKSKGMEPSYDGEEIKAVANTEKKEVVASIQSKCKDPIVFQKDIKAVDQTEKNAAAAAKVKHGESNLAHAAEEITVAAVQIEEITAKSVAGGENKLPEITTSKEVQKEWTCTVCQLTCHSEKILNSHLQGKKHRAKCKEHGESNLAHAAGEITVAAVKIEEITAKSVAGGENKLPEITTSKVVQKEWTCDVCQLACHSEKILNSLLQGKKHRAKCAEHGESNLAHAVEEITAATVQIEEITATSVAGGENKLPEITTSKEVQKEWTCAVCHQLTCHSEKILNSHLQGKKHRAKCKEHGESNLAHAAEEITVAAVQIEEITAKSVAGGENKLSDITTSKEVQKEWTCAVCHQLTCHSEKILNSHLQGKKHRAKCKEHGESNLAHAAEEITVAAVQIEEITGKSVAGGENKLPEITTSKEVQNEWTCAVCQLTCHSEKILNSHLQGKKHRAKCKEHGESNLAHAAEEITAKSVAGGENKLPEITTSKEVQKEWICTVCQLTCHSEKILNSHLQGKKHRAKCKEHGESNLVHAAKEITVAAVKIEEITAKSVAGGENKLPEITTSKEVQKEWTCAVCHQLTCHSEKILNSHLQGKKHRAKCKEHGESNLAHAAEEITVAAVQIEEITGKSVAGGENKLPEITTSKEVQNEWTCAVCQLTCHSEKILNSHLQGKKHRAKCKEHGESNLAHAAEEITVAAVQIEEITAKSVAGGENKLSDITTSKEVQKEWTCAVCHQLTCHSEKILNSHLQGKKHRAKCKEHGESNLAHAAEEITVAAVQIEEITGKSVAGGENKLPEITTSKEVQNEWTCAVCQLTCHSEKILNSHLQGKKHRAKCKEHGESNLAHAAEEITAKSVAGGENKLPEITTSKEVQKEWICTVCQLTCHSEKILNSHLQGKKHRAKCKEHGESNLVHAAKEITVAAVKIEEITAKSVAGGENKLPEITTSKEVQKEWTCAVCQLTCHCEKNLNSHLQGKKHKAKCEELNASKPTDKNKGSPFETGNKSDQSKQENNFLFTATK